MPVELEESFPGLSGSRYEVKSPKTHVYNCIAFAAGDEHRWWWPSMFGYWPNSVHRDETIQSFMDAFSTLGYSPCDDGTLESSFEKVAIYVDANGTPTHMARQLPSDVWISKCGKLEDIEHETLQALEGDIYGKVVQFLKRPLSRNND